MKSILVVFFVLGSWPLFAQSYVDSGIRHYAVGEYEEALIDFKDAEEIESMITESSKAKMYYYRGMIWLKRAEKSSGDFAEEDPLQLCYSDLTKVMSMDITWETQIEEAYERLYPLIIDEAGNYLKLEKKASEIDDKLTLLDRRIEYLQMANGLGVSPFPALYLGQTQKQAGDLLFSNSASVSDLQRAKAYYEVSINHYELARYEDPFSKEIIEELLTLSKRLIDKERIEEYEKLLQLAGG